MAQAFWSLVVLAGVLSLAAVTSAQTNTTYLNKFDTAFTFTCDPGQALTSISSVYNGWYQDRRFAMGCTGGLVGTSDCTLTNWVNKLEKDMSFECPATYYVTGTASVHKDINGDRLFSFLCCKNINTNAVLVNCNWGGMSNMWTRRMDYQAPAGHVIVGVRSMFSMLFRDRIWIFKTCTIA